MKTINIHHYQDTNVYITVEYVTDENGTVTYVKMKNGRGNILQQNNIFNRCLQIVAAETKGIATIKTVVQAELAKQAVFDAAEIQDYNAKYRLVLEGQHDFTAFENEPLREYLAY